MERGGRVELADIARPRMGGRGDLTAEYLVRKWDEVDRWLEKEMEKIMEKVEGIESGLEDMLKNLLEKIRTGDLRTG